MFKIAKNDILSRIRVKILTGIIYESLKWEMKIKKLKRWSSFISKGKYENWRNCEKCEISNRRTIPKFKFNSKSQIFVFQIEKKLYSFVNFPNCKILEIFSFSNLANSKNFQNLTISEIINFPLMTNSWNNQISEIQFRKLEIFRIWQFLTLSNFSKSNFGFPDWKQFYKFVNYANCKVLKIH